MESVQMLDVLQRYFKEIDFFYGRPNPDVVTFFVSIYGRTFKGQAFAEADDFIRIELWLNLFGSGVNYDDIRASIKSINDQIKEGEGEKWIMYLVTKEKHHLGVFTEIVADKGDISIEQCREWHQKMMEHIGSHLMLILL